MDKPQESHRTRSKAAPDWTVEESLILVNEISAVESEWGATLPSFQKWQQIVENCNALDVNRNLNQCKRKWDALLSSYRRANQGARLDRSFPAELFSAVDCCVTTKGKRDDGGGEAEEDDAVDEAQEEEEQVAMETDPDSDPEAQGHVTNFFFETGSKKQRPRMKRQKRRLETQNPWGYFTSTNTKHEESTSIQEEAKNTNNIVESMPEEINRDSQQEQIMATMLWENAMQINAILEGDLADDVDYKLADLKNAEAVQIDLTRRQGDKLIDCLGNISTTLNQLCDLVQKCN
ncbi:hypothetical protein C2S52_002741 [Perilla frutescens var. hirtella]|uniref:Myb-like domain-containing protein n=1 Tax=Perilla frutescens var. hirtella TaxID=608512 RepID=A0AAD4P8Z9_PERFH|nr:hypothetical protein C2S52_002741 [Perilla frutescens var. hirtella]KAH6831233.1 hypothetical protein C2S53_009428 [Perilla frutescens var. hirtella]